MLVINGIERRNTLELFSHLCSVVGSSNIFKVIALSRAESDIKEALKSPYSIDMREVNAPDIETIVRSGMFRLWHCMLEAEDTYGGLNSSLSAIENVGRLQDDERNGSISRSNFNTSQFENEMSVSKHLAQQNSMVPEIPELDFVRDYLIENADGVILWVVLIIQDLIKVAKSGASTIRELRHKLSTIPTSLNDLYRDILIKIRKGPYSNEQQAEYVFAWLIYANRPLKVSEFQDVVAMFHWGQSYTEDCDNFLHENRIGFLTKRWDAIQAHLWNICGGLVEIVPTERYSTDLLWKSRVITAEDSVQLIHQTARDFLLTDSEQTFLNLENQRSLELISRTSLDYLKIALPSNEGQQESMWNWKMESWDTSQHATFVRHLQDHPLLGYALEHTQDIIVALSDAAFENRDGEKVYNLPRLSSDSANIDFGGVKVLEYLHSVCYKSNSLSEICISEWARRHDIYSRLERCFKYNETYFLKRYKEAQEDLHKSRHSQRSNILQSSFGGVQPLINSRSQSRQGSLYTPSQHSTPERTSSRMSSGLRGSSRSVRSRTTSRADVYEGSPPYSSRNSNPTVSPNDLEGNHLPPRKIFTLNHSLYHACRLGLLDAARNLLTLGATVENKNYTYDYAASRQSPIYAAVQSGNHLLVRLMVVQVADLLSEQNQTWLALEYAIKLGNFEVVRELCDVWTDTSDNQARTTEYIKLARQNGRYDIIEYLLSKLKHIEVFEWR
jgi:hypothetical protein